MNYILFLLSICFSTLAATENPVNINPVINTPKTSENIKEPSVQIDKPSMFTEASTINIVYLSDGYSSNLLEASVRSVLDNSDKNDKFNFYILSGNINNLTKSRLENLLKNKSAEKYRMQFIDIDLSKYSQSDINFQATPYYLKIILPELLPNVDKAIFIDTQNIVMKSLHDTWNIDLGSKYAAVVPDLNAHIENEEFLSNSGVSQNIYSEISKFFTTSFMVLNLKEIRNAKLSEQFKKESISKKHYLQNDLGILNKLFHNNVTYLPLNTNISYKLLTAKKSLISKYKLGEYNHIKGLLKNPISVRFEDNSYNDPEHPYIKEFIKYISLSDNYNKASIEVSAINIAYIYTPDSAKRIATSIASILDNSLRTDILAFYILSNHDIDEKTKKRIEALKVIKECDIHYIRIPEAILKQIPENNLKVLRAAIPEILSDIKKIFFICSNTVILSSLKEFYNAPNSGLAIAVDASFKGSNLNQSKFNTGVMLFSADYFKENKIFEKVLAYIKEHKDASLCDAFRESVKNQIAFYHPKWNVTPHSLSLTMNDVPTGVRPDDLEALKNRPSVVHYTENSYLDNKHKFANKIKFYEEHIAWDTGKPITVWEKYSENSFAKNYNYKPTQINIAYIADQESVPFIAASIKSILANAHKLDSLKFYIIGEQLDGSTKERLSSIEKGINIHFIGVNNTALLEKYSNKNTVDKNLLLTCIHFSELINKINCNTVLYLSPNTIVRKSLQKLYNTKMYNLFALVTQHQSPSNIQTAKNRFGAFIQDSLDYFDENVMLLNLDSCRESKLSEKILEFLEKNNQAQLRDVINIVFEKNVGFVTPQWNLAHYVLQENFSYNRNLFRNSPVQYKKAMAKPIILSFPEKSYFIANNNAHPFTFEFLHYLAKTKWVNMLTFFNTKPKPVIQIKEIEVPKIIIEKEKGFGDTFKKWFLGIFKKIPTVKKADPEGLQVPEG